MASAHRGLLEGVQACAVKVLQVLHSLGGAGSESGADDVVHGVAELVGDSLVRPPRGS
jgi:hypothetical protein